MHQGIDSFYRGHIVTATAKDRRTRLDFEIFLKEFSAGFGGAKIANELIDRPMETDLAEALWGQTAW